MATIEPRYSGQEFADRGQRIFEDDIMPRLSVEDEGKFVAIDIDSGAFELDQDDFAATERLLKRHPNAQIWLHRVGDQTAYRIGGRPRLKRS